MLQYLRLISQTVQSRQLRQLWEASVVDAEVQVFVQDTKILIAALHNPTSTLQNSNASVTAKKKEREHKQLTEGYIFLLNWGKVKLKL